MTRKDYVAIAAAISEARSRQAFTPNEEDRLHALRHAAWCISTELAKDNPRFNRGRFLDACGV